MARKEKHHVFSARTTEDGLKALNTLKPAGSGLPISAGPHVEN